MVCPDSKFDMYWIIPQTAADAFTHDFFHIEVRTLRLFLFLAGEQQSTVKAPAGNVTS